MKTCLVLGVNGQDGSFLAEYLLGQGHRVLGVGRQPTSRWIDLTSSNFRYLSANLQDLAAYENILSRVQPDIIFSCAAVHGPSGFDYKERWKENLQVNCIITHASLEYLRQSLDAGLYFLGSSKSFAPDLGGPITELSPRSTNCLYSLAKNTSTELIQYYRREFKVRASVIWAFNHESTRRGSDYFIPKLVRALRQAIRGDEQTETFTTMDFWCDWGCAKEYMNCIGMMAEQEIYEDVIIARGKPVFAQALADSLFAPHGLKARNILRVKSWSRAQPVQNSWADVAKLKQLLGRIPERTVESVCLEIFATQGSLNRLEN